MENRDAPLGYAQTRNTTIDILIYAIFEDETALPTRRLAPRAAILRTRCFHYSLFVYLFK